MPLLVTDMQDHPQEKRPEVPVSYSAGSEVVRGKVRRPKSNMQPGHESASRDINASSGGGSVRSPEVRKATIHDPLLLGPLCGWQRLVLDHGTALPVPALQKSDHEEREPK